MTFSRPFKMRPWSSPESIKRALAIGLISSIAAVSFPTHNAYAQSRPEASSVVTVVPVRKEKFVDKTWISGSIVPRNSVSVVPQVAGYPVTSLEAEVGDVVKKGDVLARFDAVALKAKLDEVDAQIESAQSAINQAQSDIASAQATVDQAAAALDRTKTLVQKGDLAQAALDNTTADDATAKAKLASAVGGLAAAQSALRQVQASRVAAQLTLNQTALAAPVDGIIAIRNLNQGDLASPGETAAFIIYENAELELAGDVVETALGSLAVGNDVELSIAGLAESKGKLRLIAPTVDGTTRLGSVRVSLTDATGVRAGLFSSGWIVTDTRESLSLPTTAVQTDGDGTYVLVETNGILARTTVEAGLIKDTQREILSGLSEGQSVVARAGGFFTDGDKVTPVELKDAK